MKKFWLPLVWFLLAENSSAQKLILNESFGSVSVNTSIQQHSLNSGFINKNLVFNGGNVQQSADIRNSSHSGSAYTQWNGSESSGGANVFFSSVGERGFAMHHINTQSFDSLSLYFAYRKESVSSNALFRVDYQTEIQSGWDSLLLNNLPPPEAPTGWYYIGPISLPHSAISSQLSIRFTSFNSAMRIDDVSLVGNQTKTWLRSEISSLTFSNQEQELIDNWQFLRIQVDGIDLADTLFIRTKKPFLVFSDTFNFNEIAFQAFDTSLFELSLWVKTMDTSRGNYTDNLLIYTKDHDSLMVNLILNQRYQGEKKLVWNCNDTIINSEEFHCSVSAFKQMNNNGNTQFLSSSSASELYSDASGGNNAAFSAKGITFDTNTSTYLSWKIKPDSLKITWLFGISFGMRSTSTGPKNWRLLHSANNFSNELCSGTIENNSNWWREEHQLSGFSFTEEVEFRLYFFDGDGGAPVSIANFRLDDLTMQLCTWNQINYAVFSGNKTGHWSDTNYWKYNYYDSFYRAANQIPGPHNTLFIGSHDTLILDEDISITKPFLNGRIALNGQALTIKNGWNGAGKLNGHPQSNLTLNGHVDTLNLALNPHCINSLEINTQSGVTNLGDSLFIQSHLKLTEGKLNSGGYLKLVIGEDGYPAQIIPEGKGFVEGTMCMKQQIPGNQKGWRALSSPLDTVSIGQLGNQMEINLGGNSNPNTANAFFWNESTATWETLQQSNKSFRREAVNVYLPYPNSKIFEVCGLFDTLPQNYGKLSFNQGKPQEEGWHLIGNPYPWHINWNALDLPIGMEAYYAIWSAEDGNYRYWNGITGAAGQLIPPMHGFWVKVNQTLPENFILNRSHGDTGKVNHLYKNQSRELVISIQLQQVNGRFKDRIELYETETNTATDVKKLNGLSEAPEIWILDSENRYAIKQVGRADSFLIGVKTPKKGLFQFQLLSHSMEYEDWYLVDKQSNQSHSLSTNTTISIEMDKGEYLDRFILRKGKITNYINPLAENISPQKRGDFIYFPTHSDSPLNIYSLDGRLLKTLHPECINNEYRYGPIDLNEGWYAFHFSNPKNRIRKLIWWD